MRFPQTLLLFALVALVLVFAPRAWAQQKPFSQSQVSDMVRAGLGDESGAKLIEQRGLDFAPTADFLQNLKAAGANEAFLNALRAAKAPEEARPTPPLTQVQILALLAGGVPPLRVATLVTQRGINFDVTDDFLQDVRRGGGTEDIINALKNATVTKPAAPVNAAEQARQTEVRQHMARGSELANHGQYAQAEQEYRAALQLDPQNADLNASLAFVLIRQQKWDAAESADRTALGLDPNNDMAHNNLGVALGSKGDLQGAIAQFREALRLNPNLADAHANLGVALGMQGDLDGAIAQYRAALRSNPNYAAAHYNLGVALDRKGDFQNALVEFRAAYQLNPNDADYKQSYERLSKQVKQ